MNGNGKLLLSVVAAALVSLAAIGFASVWAPGAEALKKTQALEVVQANTATQIAVIQAQRAEDLRRIANLEEMVKNIWNAVRDERDRKREERTR
jgi:hypothetical protein